MSAFPLILAAGAVALFIGGKKKTSKPAQDDGFVDDTSTDDGQADTGDGPDPDGTQQSTDEGYGTVASGMRRDKRGAFSWRVKYDADGYHAQVLMGNSRFAPVQEEVGIAASASGAKDMLRERFNELLIDRYPDEEPLNDPASTRKISQFAAS